MSGIEIVSGLAISKLLSCPFVEVDRVRTECEDAYDTPHIPVQMIKISEY